MSELFSRMDPGDLIGLVAVGGGLLCGMVGIVMGCWLEWRKVSSASELKHNMLERGMSADEIATVLNAGGGSSRFGCGKRSSRV